MFFLSWCDSLESFQLSDPLWVQLWTSETPAHNDSVCCCCCLTGWCCYWSDKSRRSDSGWCLPWFSLSRSVDMMQREACSMRSPYCLPLSICLLGSPCRMMFSYLSQWFFFYSSLSVLWPWSSLKLFFFLCFCFSCSFCSITHSLSAWSGEWCECN